MNKTIYKKISILLICLLIFSIKNTYAYYTVNNSCINMPNNELLDYIKNTQPIYNELYYLGDNVYSSLVKKQNPDTLIQQIDYAIANLNSLRENIFIFSNNPNISSNDQNIALGVLITTGYYRLAYQSLKIALTTNNTAMQLKYLEDFFRYSTLGLSSLSSIEKNFNL